MLYNPRKVFVDLRLTCYTSTVPYILTYEWRSCGVFYFVNAYTLERDPLQLPLGQHGLVMT